VNDTTTLDELEAALDELSTEADEIDETVVIVEGPRDERTLDEILAGHALLKGDAQSRTFINGKAVYRNADVIHAEREARTREQTRKRQQLKRRMERRAKRQAAMDAKPVDAVRMAACLALLGNLTHVIANLTLARYNRFRRVLGDVMVDDIAQDATLRIAEALSKSNVELMELARAAIWLKTAPQPYVSADGPQGAGRLLGTIVTVISRTIVDTYRANTTVAWVEGVDDNGKTVWEKRDTTLTSFELLETIAHNTRTDVDDMLSHTKANNKAKIKGCAPGMRDKRQFARMVVDAAIEARGLNALANMLLDEDRVRSDGSFKWTENADTIWTMLGLPAMNTDSPRLKAVFAKRAVEIAFEFLPGVIAATYEIIEDPTVMWHVDVQVRDLVMKAALYRPCNVEASNPMDGGGSLEYSLALMDDPERCRRALAMMYANEEANA
jgi:hypothetical protein